MKNWRKTVKKATSLFLAVIILLGTCKGVSFATEKSGTKTEASKSTSTNEKLYTVQVNNIGGWTLMNLEKSKGPVTLTYTVESSSVAGSDNYGVTGTNAPGEDFPYSGGHGKMSFTNGANEIVKAGYTYSFTISMEDTKLVYDGSYKAPDKSTGKIQFTKDSYGEGSYTGNAEYFGIYVGAKTTAKLVNVSCVDSEGNDLGIRSNRLATQVKVYDAENTLPKDTEINTYYDVEFNGNADFSIGNVNLSETARVFIEYKVESVSYTRLSQEGVLMSADLTAGYPHLTGNLSHRQNPDPSLLLEEGAEYIICMERHSADFATRVYKTKNGVTTMEEITTSSWKTFNEATQYYALWFSMNGQFKLTDFKIYDGKHNDLGVQSTQAVITKRTDEIKKTYTVQVNNIGGWTLMNLEKSSGPVTLTYTVESSSVAGKGNYGVTGTNAPGEDFPYAGGHGKMSFTNGTNEIVKAGYTYSFTISMDGTKLVYDGSYRAPDKSTGKIKFTKDSYGEGSFTGNAEYFGIYVDAKTTAKLVNVSCVDSEGNDLGVRSSKLTTQVKIYDTENALPKNMEIETSYDVEFEGNADFCIGNVKLSETARVFIEYKVESASYTRLSQEGVLMSADLTAAYPHLTGNLSHRQNPNPSLLLEEGAEYIICMERHSKDFATRVYKTKNGVTTMEEITTTSWKDFNEATQYYALWFSMEGKFKLTDFKIYDGNNNELGLQSTRADIVKSGETGGVKPTTAIKQYYDVEFSGSSDFSVGNLKKPETSNMYIEYKVDSAEYTRLSQEGTLMSANLTESYPYLTGGLNYAFYSDGKPKTSVLLDEGAEYIICMERYAGGFKTKVWKTKDGVTSKYSFDRLSMKEWSDATQYFALWFAMQGEFKLTNVKIYDGNENDLGVYSSQALVTKGGETKNSSDIDTSNVKKYSAWLSTGGSFFCNEIPAGSTVGTQYFMTYTVDVCNALPVQSGIIGTSDNTLNFPYVDAGILNFKYAENAPHLLEVGATYNITFTITNSGYMYKVVQTKGDVVQKVRFLSTYSEDKDGIKNTYDNLGYFGLWFAGGNDMVKLSNVSFYDANGKDLGVWLTKNQGVFASGKLEPSKDSQVSQSYDVEVKEQGTIAVGNAKLAKTSKIYMEYKVEYADYNLAQEGVLMSADLKNNWPYLTGHLNYNKYTDGLTKDSLLLDPGAEYIIMMEHQDEGFVTQIWKTKAGETTLLVLQGMYKKEWTDATQFFSLWFAASEKQTASFKLTNFKCYDSEKNNLGVQCNQNASIVQYGEVEDYELCEATYYCVSNDTYFVLNKDQTVQYATAQGTSSGKYSVSLPNISMKLDGTKKTYDYLYTRITDSDGLEYNRLYNYKLTYETGTDTLTQTFSHEEGYFAEKPEDPTLEGCEFLGWYLADGTEYDFEHIVSESVTLYAKYSGDGGIFYVGDVDIPVNNSNALFAYAVSGTIIVLIGVVVCVFMIKKGRKSGRINEK